jgi:hypothetical protein
LDIIYKPKQPSLGLIYLIFTYVGIRVLINWIYIVFLFVYTQNISWKSLLLQQRNMFRLYMWNKRQLFIKEKKDMMLLTLIFH